MENSMNDELDLAALARMIDHSLLHPSLSDDKISAGCHLALQCGAATACVKPYAIGLAKEILKGSHTEVCAVVAFPHGNSVTALKVREAEDAVRSGASEIDMVVNIGKVLSGAWEYVAAEIRAVNQAVTGEGAILKVIFENDFLADGHIRRLCAICAECATAFVKTSTGYGFVQQADGKYSYAGATEHQVRLMRESCPPSVKVKAAGGIRTLDDLLRFRRLGAARIGASATAAILEEAKQRGYS
jgi:deoxyribose-phosphate aldolase